MNTAAAISPTRFAARIVGCAVLTAIGAQLAMPLPYTPVPVTWQVAGVLFAGLALAPGAAFASQAIYLAVGCLGAPVFAGLSGGAHVIAGPTGGYLLSYPVAAWIVAQFAGRVREEGLAVSLRRFAVSSVGIAVVYAVGCIQLAFVAQLPVAQAVVQGAGVFVLWDLAKALVVCGGMAAYQARRHGGGPGSGRLARGW